MQVEDGKRFPTSLFINATADFGNQVAIGISRFPYISPMFFSHFHFLSELEKRHCFHLLYDSGKLSKNQDEGI